MVLGKVEGDFLIDPVRMKQMGQSRNNTHMWMSLLVKVKSDAPMNNIA